MRRRDLTEDERALWEAHTEQDASLPKKIAKRKKVATPAAEKKEVMARRVKPPAPNPAPAPPSAAKPHHFLLQAGDMRALDGSNASQLQRGKRPIEATLDLHGFGRVTGFTAFCEFVLSCRAAGKRRLLVITGKGRSSGEPGGVLRSALAQWVNDEAVRSSILAYDKAQPRHGGDGAFYLLLKKR